jgi:glycosyltransferase involved in cell wall biosynthesis
MELSQSIVNTPSELTAVRQSQLDKSKTDWIWIVDGDEIYPTGLAEEVLAAIKRGYEGVVVRRYDLLGDIYHRQDERVGEYRLFGHRGHLVTRLLNRSLIKGLHYQGDYPLEGFVDSASQSTRERDSTKWYITKNRLYHAMYLIRSSSGGNLSSVLHRHKYKLERGIPITGRYPDVFDLPRPAVVPDPRHRRPLSYELVAAIVTPVKQLKRRLI